MYAAVNDVGFYSARVFLPAAVEVEHAPPVRAVGKMLYGAKLNREVCYIFSISVTPLGIDVSTVTL